MMQQILSLLSFSGRMNRQRYWVTSVLVYFAVLAASLVAASVPIVGGVVAAPVVLGGLWVGLAAGVRRLHDRNKAWWWMLLMYLPSLLLSALGEVVAVSSPEAGGALRLLGIPFSLWVFVELGCLRGTDGPNRFGPHPLKPELAEVFG
jgi:uncharacterized membrane protein YhaH (DUF805 family)